jgi:hypothetical protein
VPVVLAEAGRTSERRCRGEPGAHGIEILLGNGRVLRLDATLDPAVAARFASALEGLDR